MVAQKQHFVRRKDSVTLVKLQTSATLIVYLINKHAYLFYKQQCDQYRQIRPFGGDKNKKINDT